MENPGRSPSTERISMLAAQFRMILGKAKRRLREHGGRHELTPSQVSVVLRLEKEGPTTLSPRQQETLATALTLLTRLVED